MFTIVVRLFLVLFNTCRFLNSDQTFMNTSKSIWGLLDRNGDGKVSVLEAAFGNCFDCNDFSYIERIKYIIESSRTTRFTSVCLRPSPDPPSLLDCITSQAREKIYELDIKSSLTLETLSSHLSFDKAYLNYLQKSGCEDISPWIHFTNTTNRTTEEIISHNLNCEQLVSYDQGLSEFDTNMCDIIVPNGFCLFSCRSCGFKSTVQSAVFSHMNRKTKIPQSSSTDISKGMTEVFVLITSDWHIEPWYEIDKMNTAVARYSHPSIDLMLNCFNTKGLITECILNSESDPPYTFIDSHFVSYLSISDREDADTSNYNNYNINNESIINNANNNQNNVIKKTFLRKSKTFQEKASILKDTLGLSLISNNSSSKSESQEKNRLKETTTTTQILKKLTGNRYTPISHTNISRGLFFYIGDTQAHDYSDPNIGSCDEADAVYSLMSYALRMISWHWDRQDVFICAGNNDGPHSSIFIRGGGEDADPVSAAWARAMVEAGIVNNDLGRRYDSSRRRLLRRSSQGPGGLRMKDPSSLDTSTTTNIHTRPSDHDGVSLGEGGGQQPVNVRQGAADPSVILEGLTEAEGVIGEEGRGSEDERDGAGEGEEGLNEGDTYDQIQYFQHTGYYIKQIDPKNHHGLYAAKLFAIMINTNLGKSHISQQAALLQDLEYVSSIGGGVYILGHHPSVVADIIPSQYFHILKGQFAGHVHYARNTDEHLFTQVPAISQFAYDTAFYIGKISAERDYILRLNVDEDLYAYERGKGKGKPSNPSLWKKYSKGP